MPGIKICSLTKRAVEVFDFIKENGPVTPKQIALFTSMPSRTIFFAISNLVDEDLVKKTPDLTDMRNISYSINPDRIAELQEIVLGLISSYPLQVDDELKDLLDLDIDPDKGIISLVIG
ncbi:MAG: MarR family transcriptional regulator [Candidatus Thorarchaeota archaeon]